MRIVQLITMAAAIGCSAFAYQSDFNWSGTVAPGQTLEVRNINGSVRAELATSNTIEVNARKTADRSDVNSVRIAVVQTSNGVTVCPVYSMDPPSSNDCSNNNNGRRSENRDNDVRVDFTVKVPAGVRFAPKTVNGGVTATGLRSDVDAASVNGNVKVATSGLSKASTVNGSIEVTIGSSNWTDALHFKTVNGSIDVTLPASTNADIHATTVSGSLKSDFALTVSGRVEPREMNARIGSGGHRIELSTVNGAITLHQGDGRVI